MAKEASNMDKRGLLSALDRHARGDINWCCGTKKRSSKTCLIAVLSLALATLAAQADAAGGGINLFDASYFDDTNRFVPAVPPDPVVYVRQIADADRGVVGTAIEAVKYLGRGAYEHPYITVAVAVSATAVWLTQTESGAATLEALKDATGSALAEAQEYFWSSKDEAPDADSHQSDKKTPGALLVHNVEAANDTTAPIDNVEVGGDATASANNTEVKSDNAATVNDEVSGTTAESQTAPAPAQPVMLEQAQPASPMLDESPAAVIMPIRPAAGSYISNAWAANTMFQMNLNDRLGSYYQTEAIPQQGSAWIRYSGSRGHLKDNSGELRTAGNKNTVMMGVDMLAQSTHAQHQFTIGVMGGYGHYRGHTNSNSFDYSTKGKVNGYSVGLYGTYQKSVATQHGFYADSSVLWNHFDNRVKGGDLPAEKYDSKGMTASLELGYHIPLADRNNVQYVLQPHAQVMYQNVRSENFRQADGTDVDFINRSRVQTALGVRAAVHITTGLTSVITPHIEANWLHANKGYGVSMDNAEANMNSGRNIGQVKLGVRGDMNRHVSLNIEVFHHQGNAGYHETGGNVTAKYRF
ncbi:hypothetical protein CAL21_09420 [Bordetella genomosp. 4]|nr:hypothetical protein CAL21_09420 [Bordetella genomosp. 4]